MSLESLAPAQARAGERLLAQYLLICPGCAKPSAAHVDEGDAAPGSGSSLVRFVCPDGCAVAPDTVLRLLPAGELRMSA